jgi:hypothetical protein
MRERLCTTEVREVTEEVLVEFSVFSVASVVKTGF